MAKAMDFFRPWTPGSRGDLYWIQASTAASREKKRCGVPIKFQMLTIVVVACEIEVDSVFAEKGVPVVNKGFVIAVEPIWNS